jgi:hypothetical protein
MKVIMCDTCNANVSGIELLSTAIHICMFCHQPWSSRKNEGWQKQIMVVKRRRVQRRSIYKHNTHMFLAESQFSVAK